MIKERLKDMIEKAFNQAAQEGKMGPLTECPEPIIIERPKLAEHGDLACGVALKLARHARSAPLKIAETIAEYIKGCPDAQNGALQKFEVASPGFINFDLGKSWLTEVLHEIHIQKENYGKQNVGEGKKILLEYVSANPTGNLHIGHARGAVLGSALANLFKFAGYNCDQEFYINDVGAQIQQLGVCALAAYKRKLGKNVDYPTEGYPEESIEEYVDEVIKQHGNKFLDLEGEDVAAQMADIIKEVIRAYQEQLLEKLHIKFDRWFSEGSLRQENKVDAAMEQLAKNNFTYEQDGALWLKAKELGDERDRVLRKSTGAYTYLANDAAYHLDKLSRGYDLLINIWGADHHGQVPGLKAIVEALGHDRKKIEVILTQIVNLSRDGQIVRMSKRRGTVVMLDEVVDEVGVDAVRYYLAESNPQNPINFDLELAKKTSRDNPAFYIQYAHARCSSILRRALEPYKNPDTGVEESPPLTKEQFEQFKAEYESNPKVFLPAFDDNPEIFNHQKSLVMKLESFPDEVKDAALTWMPGKLARYAYEVANDLQKFYEVSRVITDDLSVTKARLGLIMATRQVLANVLNIVGISAPERM